MPSYPDHWSSGPSRSSSRHTPSSTGSYGTSYGGGNARPSVFDYQVSDFGSAAPAAGYQVPSRHDNPSTGRPDPFQYQVDDFGRSRPSTRSHGAPPSSSRPDPFQYMVRDDAASSRHHGASRQAPAYQHNYPYDHPDAERYDAPSRGGADEYYGDGYYGADRLTEPGAEGINEEDSNPVPAYSAEARRGHEVSLEGGGRGGGRGRGDAQQQPPPPSYERVCDETARELMEMQRRGW